MKDYENPHKSETGFKPDIPGLIIALGLILIVFSTFMDFTPVCQRSWRAGGVGLPVMLSCMVGVVLALRKNYFSVFFISIFAAFFLTHEIIIIYDARAVELGQELRPDGWFRSVIQVYMDALQPGYGALWGVIGAATASLASLIGLAVEVIRKNLEAADYSTSQKIADEMPAEDETSDYDEHEESGIV